MISVLKKIWQFAGDEQKEISRSVVLSFFYAIFHVLQMGAIYYVLIALTEEQAGNQAALVALLLLVISIAGRAGMNYAAQLKQTHAGYFMVANKRIAIGERLKIVPMGYFNENSLGEITGVTTTVLDDVENTAPAVLVNMLGGFINSLVFIVMVLFFDWRIGLLVTAGTGLYLLITAAMERKSALLAPKRQESATRLVGAVLEQIQGMSVIKSFNLTGRGDHAVRAAIEYNRVSNLNIERLFTPYTIAQEMVLHSFSVLMMLASVWFCVAGSMGLAEALMGVIMSFLIFAQIESAGSSMAVLRLVGSSIDQAEQLDELPVMDSDGRDIRSKSHQIEFEKVSFSYEQLGDSQARQTLSDISIRLPDKSTTAIIGPSGSGKTTLCNLIARFWDVNDGVVRIGGTDVREYTLESLMDQISMVFQNVYLFADTVENNIRFARPDAGREEVIAAAKKACCHEFITQLPNGYDTQIGEGGSSLSGGEKQRISIARAMLKDAPIVIFDEATANVDPENEERLQQAIEALMADKTIIMIAHRLKTVRNADQILVLDKGRIVQQGRHEELIKEQGIYADFVFDRKTAVSWKL